MIHKNADFPRQWNKENPNIKDEEKFAKLSCVSSNASAKHAITPGLLCKLV